MAMSEHANMPDRYVIHAEKLYPGGGRPARSWQRVEIEGGCITAIADAGPGDADATFAILAPGFIDLQINGAGGVMFNDTPDEGTLARMVGAARIGGACHILPTYITAPGTGYSDALAAVDAWDGPEILGIHLEGPFLSAAKPGIHPATHIRRLDDQDMDLLLAHRGRILLTLAPEEVNKLLLERLARAGVVLFAGHSNAGCDTVIEATDAGLRGVTHLFNACSQITAREPGVVGAAFCDQRLFAGIIADGHHVAARNLRLAHEIMKGRLFLVSDTMPTFGSDITSFTIGDERISLENGRLRSRDGRLAGAHLGLDRAVRVMIEDAGVVVAEALHMASGIPASVLGLEDQLGSIAVGRPVSLPCLNSDFEAVAVAIAGRLFRNEGGNSGG